MEIAAVASQINYEPYLIRGISYDAYLAQLQQIVANKYKGLKPDGEHLEYLPINLKRKQ